MVSIPFSVYFYVANCNLIMYCMLFIDKISVSSFPPFEVVFEDEDTIIIQRPDTEDSSITRKDKHTFKDGLLYERRCLE